MSFLKACLGCSIRQKGSSKNNKHIKKNDNIVSLLMLKYHLPLSLCVLGAAVYESVCDGTEDIQTLQDPYTDTSQLRITNMVYKAVYAIAHAIHNEVCQDTNSTAQCDKFTRIDSKQVR